MYWSNKVVPIAIICLLSHQAIVYIIYKYGELHAYDVAKGTVVNYVIGVITVLTSNHND